MTDGYFSSTCKPGTSSLRMKWLGREANQSPLSDAEMK